MKKILVVLLTLCMVLSMTTTAFAEEVDVIDTQEELAAALAAGGEVTLGGDIELKDTVTVPGGVTVTLDLNGKTISQTKEQTAGYQMILNDGNLTIKDSGNGTGKISYTDSGNGGEYISDTIYNRAVLVINGGTIENISSSTVASNGYPHAVDTYSGIRDTSLTINGGTIYCAEYSAVRMFCVSATHKADLVINEGATIKGAVDMQNGTAAAALGTLTINGGTFETTKNANNIRFANWNGGAKEYGITAAIKGGNFNGGITTKYVPAEANFDSKIITGGTFANKDLVVSYLEDGFAFDDNGTVYDPTKDGIIDTEVELSAALAAGGEVVLAGDIVLENTVTVPGGVTVTLDLNGKTISMVKTGEITASHTMILNKGNLTVTDSSEAGTGKISYHFDGTSNKAWAYAVTTISNQQGTLTIKKGTVESLSLSTNTQDVATNVYKFTIDSLTNGNGGDATLNIEGGKITAAKGGPVRGFANSTTCTNTINISGGEFVGQVWMQDPNAFANKGVLNITGGTFTPNATGVDAVYFYGLGDSSGFELNIGGNAVVNGTTYLTAEESTKAFTGNISGGTFNDEVWSCVWVDDTNYIDVPVITGGVFVKEVYAGYCVEGYVPCKNEDDTYTVHKQELTEIPAKEPTCTEVGNVVYYKDACGKYFLNAEDALVDKAIVDLKTVEIPAKGHTLTAIAAVKETCTTAGNKAYYTCTCGEWFWTEADAQANKAIADHAEVVIPAAHTLTEVPAVAATTTSEGNIRYWKCVCEKLFVDAAAKMEITDKASVVIAKIPEEAKDEPVVKEEIKVQVEVKEETVVEAVDKAVEDAIKDTPAGETPAKVEVTIDVTAKDETVEEKVAVTQTQLPTTALDKVEEKDASLTVAMTDATVTLDEKAVEAVVEKAATHTESTSVVLSVDVFDEEHEHDEVLTDAQEKAVDTLTQETTVANTTTTKTVALTVKLTIETDKGDYLGDFKGGNATIVIPYEVKAEHHYEVYYIDDNGNVTKVENVRQTGNGIVFETGHFSEYVVLEVKNTTVQPAPQPQPQAPQPQPQAPQEQPQSPHTGDNSPVALLVGLMTVAGMFAVVADKKRRF